MTARGLAWRPCAVTAGGIVTRDYAVTETGVVERASDTSQPHGEQLSYRWASYAASPSLDAWAEAWADGPGPRDLPPGDVEWRTITAAQVRQIKEAL